MTDKEYIKNLNACNENKILSYEFEKRHRGEKLLRKYRMEKRDKNHLNESLERMIAKLSEDNRYILLANASDLYKEQQCEHSQW